jgi:hypothetical protein
VVQAPGDPQKPYAGADIEVEFGNPNGVNTIVPGGSVAAFSLGVDAALLALPSAPPPGSEPVELRVRARGYLVRWQTYGYSNAAEVAGKLGQEYGGTIRTSDPRRFQLLVEQQWGDPSGLSGSPCIVGGQVVGLIFGRCVGLVARELPQLEIAKVTRAYVRDVTFLIKDFTVLLEQTAAQLRDGADADEVADAIAPEQLPGRVAEAMMRGTSDALLGITSLKAAFLDRHSLTEPTDPPQSAGKIFDFATRTWIDSDAIRALAETLIAGDKIVVMNTHSSEIASWYVHRAGCEKDNAPGRFEYSAPVPLQTIGFEALLADFETTVAGLFGLKRDELADFLEEEHDHATRPIVVWLDSVPERADLDAVRGHRAIYAQIRVVLLAGPDIPDGVKNQYADAKLIEPYLEAERADQALTERTNAERRFRRIFNPKLASIKS